METQIRSLRDNIAENEERFKGELEELRKTLTDTIKSQNEQLEQYIQEEQQMKEFREQKEKLDRLIAKLQQDVENEKKARMQEGTEKDREKLQATEKLRREMLKQIKMTKASLLALNDD